MAWFRHPESGQIFEATGVEEKFARQRACVEVDPPAPAPEVPATEDPVTEEPTTVEVDPPAPAPKKGGK